MTCPKYKEGPLYIDIMNFLNGFSYNLCEVYPSCREKNGWVTECDLIFSKKQYSI